MQNYDMLVERIAKSANLEKEEIERQVEAKRAKLSGLISKEGAAQIVAAELGIRFEDQELKVSELMQGMKRISITGKIITLFPVREYEKNGRSGKVANFILADDTGNLRVVLWDTNHISLIENGEIGQDDFVEIRNAAMRESEIHLSGFSEIKKSSKVIENIKTELMVAEKEISELQQGQNVKVRGIVVQMFQPRFYSVCPECNKKIVPGAEGFNCDEHGKVQPKDRAVLNFVLDDGSETIRVVLFSEQINKVIPEEDLKNTEKAIAFRDDWLGTEVCVSGNVRKNQLFNNLEINVVGVERVDVEKLIAILESKNK